MYRNSTSWWDTMKRRLTFILSVSVSLVLVYLIWDGESLTRQDKRILSPKHREKYNDTLLWVVHVEQEDIPATGDSVDNIASELGLENIGPVADMDGSYLFSVKGQYHQPKASVNKSLSALQLLHSKMYESKDLPEIVSLVEEKLDQSPHISWYSHEKIVSRAKRWFSPTAFMNFQDPMYKKQWHLTNTKQRGMDTNVTDVWRHNVTGQGVTVAVVDDGLEWNNPDLKDNYNRGGSWDFNDDDDDPMPDGSKESNHHGTRCAGEISALPNNICGVGVAYGAKVSGLRILDGPMTDSLEASAFTKFFQINDIYSCSWGPDDDGKTVDGPHVLAAAAIKRGIDFGRHGYGNIYVVASGNGGSAGDNCNFDGYANSIYTVTIGAVDETGHMPYYSEECASMLAVTFSSGNTNTRDIVTTDWTASFLHSRSGCTQHHTGTSAAAPLAAGMIALMLQVQPCLTWRDVQYLIILTAKKVDVDVADWHRSGAGLWHSHKHGFGLMSAWRLTNAARVWNMVPWLTSFQYSGTGVNLQIPKDKRSPLKISNMVTKSETDRYALYILETVQVTVSIDHPCRGNLDIKLVSPYGTESTIGAARRRDNSSNGFDQWTFATVRCWGEVPYGTWILTITDTGHSPALSPGTLKSWSLKLYGTPMTQKEFRSRRAVIEKAMHGGLLNRSSHCPPPPVTAQPDVVLSVKTLKTIVLIGAFCILMAIYESLEYLFCYNDEKKEQSKMVKLLKRAHRLTRDTLNRNRSDSNCGSNEQTALLSEEIAMETFQSSNELGSLLGAVGENGQGLKSQSDQSVINETAVAQSSLAGACGVVDQSGEGVICRTVGKVPSGDSRANTASKSTESGGTQQQTSINRQQLPKQTKNGYMLLPNISEGEEEEDSL